MWRLFVLIASACRNIGFVAAWLFFAGCGSSNEVDAGRPALNGKPVLAALSQTNSENPQSAPPPSSETAPVSNGADQATTGAAPPNRAYQGDADRQDVTTGSFPDPGFACTGHFAQGGFVVCRTDPGTEISIDGHNHAKSDAAGLVVIGFDRDAMAQAEIVAQRASPQGVVTKRFTVAIARRSFNIQRIDGLPDAVVNPTEPALLARIAKEGALKKAAFSSQAMGSGFAQSWIWPLQAPFRVSAAWGGQRILNNIPKSPHYGIDLAVPKGTSIRAPADGVVVLAEPDLHYEGGLVLIDHGQGLVSAYLHMSRLDVRVGQIVKQGQILGAVGATGRATGPHLCWRLKWRDNYLDPSLAVQP